MSRKLFSSLVLALGAMAFQPSGAAWADPVSFTPLPAVPFDYAQDPNPKGIDGNRIVGTYYDDDAGYDYGFYYDGSTFTSLGEDVYAEGISGNTIVGSVGSQGFTYDISSQQFQYFDRPGANATRFEGIDGSNIVGWSYDGVAAWTGFLYDGGAFTPIDASGSLGASNTFATAIYGDFIGGYYTKSLWYQYSPFVYQISTGDFLDVTLPDEFGATSSQVTGISDQIMVGTYYSSVDSARHAWVYDLAEGQVYSVNATGSDPSSSNDTGGASGNKFVGYANDLSYTQFGYVATFSAVPEIDPAGMGSVAALVTGALGLIERRRLKAKMAA